MRPKRKKSAGPKVAGYVGIGLDNQDDQTRVTRGDAFMLLGGSEETHGKMQETAIKVHEKLAAKGRTVRDLTPTQLLDVFKEVDS